MRLEFRTLLIPLAALIMISAAGAGEKPVFGGVITFAMDRHPVTLDNQLAVDAASLMVVGQIQEGLYCWSRDRRLYPRLAEDFPEPALDGCIIRLRRDVLFHDGSSFDAEDVAFTFQRLKELGELVRTQFLFSGIKEISVIDARHILVKTGGNVNIVELLARPEMLVLSSSAIRKYGSRYGSVAAIGSGPFMLKLWSKGEQVELARNPDYWMPRDFSPIFPDEGITVTKLAGIPTPIPTRLQDAEATPAPTPKPIPRLPYLRNLIFKTGYPDRESRLKDVKHGNVSGLVAGPQDLGELVKRKDMRIVSSPGRTIEQVYIHTRRHPLQSKKLRLALSNAIDRQAVIDEVFSGFAHPASEPLPGWVFRRLDAAPTPDPASAAAILKKMGFTPKKPLILPLIFTDEWHFREQARLLKEQFEPLGIKLDLEPLPKAKLFDRIYGLRGEKRGNYALALEDYLYWPGGLDPAQFLDDLYRSDSPKNKAFFKNDQVDRLLIQLSLAADADSRLEICRRASSIIAGCAPTWFLCFPDNAYAMRWNLRGEETNPIFGLEFTRVWEKR